MGCWLCPEAESGRLWRAYVDDRTRALVVAVDLDLEQLQALRDAVHQIPLRGCSRRQGLEQGQLLGIEVADGRPALGAKRAESMSNGSRGPVPRFLAAGWRCTAVRYRSRAGSTRPARVGGTELGHDESNPSYPPADRGGPGCWSRLGARRRRRGRLPGRGGLRVSESRRLELGLLGGNAADHQRDHCDEAEGECDPLPPARGRYLRLERHPRRRRGVGGPSASISNPRSHGSSRSMSANSAAAWPIEMVSPSSAQTLRATR